MHRRVPNRAASPCLSWPWVASSSPADGENDLRKYPAQRSLSANHITKRPEQLATLHRVTLHAFRRRTQAAEHAVFVPVLRNDNIFVGSQLLEGVTFKFVQRA